jgi:hypothetical protein
MGYGDRCVLLLFMKMKVSSAYSVFHMDAKLCCWSTSKLREMVLLFPLTKYSGCMLASQQGSCCVISGLDIIEPSFDKDERDRLVIVYQERYIQQIIEI